MECWQEGMRANTKRDFLPGMPPTIDDGFRGCAKMRGMKSLFDLADRASLLQRLDKLQADTQRQWGKMNAAQMVTHCARALETGTGDRPMKQKLIGKILMPFFRKSILGEKPFSRNGPTDPSFIVADEREFSTERQKLVDLIAKFVQR